MMKALLVLVAILAVAAAERRMLENPIDKLLSSDFKKLGKDKEAPGEQLSSCAVHFSHLTLQMPSHSSPIFACKPSCECLACDLKLYYALSIVSIVSILNAMIAKRLQLIRQKHMRAFEVIVVVEVYLCRNTDSFFLLLCTLQTLGWVFVLWLCSPCSNTDSLPYTVLDPQPNHTDSISYYTDTISHHHTRWLPWPFYILM